MKNAPIRPGFFGRGFIPWDVAGRILLLFASLCLIKLVMLAGFRKHLFEIHWRVDRPAHTWMGDLAFYVFALLTGATLWQLGTRCAA